MNVTLKPVFVKHRAQLFSWDMTGCSRGSNGSERGGVRVA